MMKMKQATMKKTSSRILPFVMIVILLAAALMPFASAAYGVDTWYYDLVTNRTGGTINSTMTWVGKSYAVSVDESASYMKHENRLIFNGSDDPDFDGYYNVSMILDNGSVTNSGVVQNTFIEDNGDTIICRYEKSTGCHTMHVTFDYTVGNKDFVTKQEMDAYAYALFATSNRSYECLFD